MATVESPGVAARREAAATAQTQSSLGRLGPWQLVRLLSEGNLTRVYQARPADDLANQPAAPSPSLDDTS